MQWWSCGGREQYMLEGGGGGTISSGHTGHHTYTKWSPLEGYRARQKVTTISVKL